MGSGTHVYSLPVSTSNFGSDAPFERSTKFSTRAPT